jgi:hypothetical protein
VGTRDGAGQMQLLVGSAVARVRKAGTEQEQLNPSRGIGGGEGQAGRAHGRRASRGNEWVVISRRAIRCARPGK